MTKCLYTNLISVVSDNNLITRDEIKFVLDNSNEDKKVILQSYGGVSKIRLIGDGTLKVNGNSITSPYNIQGICTVTVGGSSASNVAFAVDKKETLTQLRATLCLECSADFKSLSTLQRVSLLEFTHSVIDGSLLDVIPKVESLASFVIDTPYNVIKDGNIRSFINTIAANTQLRRISMAFRPGSVVSGGITDIPAVFNGTYIGRTADIYFTNDTTTYPHGWYGRNPNGTYYNANDEVIETPQ